jgi:hypothetical protein
VKPPFIHNFVLDRFDTYLAPFYYAWKTHPYRSWRWKRYWDGSSYSVRILILILILIQMDSIWGIDMGEPLEMSLRERWGIESHLWQDV